MSTAGRDAYRPQDSMFLWWLAQPAQPRLVGELHLVAGARAVGLRYAPGWLEQGFALSTDLPLRDELFLPPAKDEAAGAVDDARPDRWGERVIRKFEKTPRLSILEFLYFAGADRYGALGVSLAGDDYQPWGSSPVPGLRNLAEMAEVVRKVLANEPVPQPQQRLLRPGVSMGGARPKSLLMIDGEPWLVKFSEGEDMDTELVEHAAMTLAARCGIHVAQTRALPVGRRHAVAVRRWDRAGGSRLHALSAHVVLRAAGETLGYPQLAQLLRRMAPADAIAAQQQQLFRRLVFNILVDNTDDHEKNHALLRRADGLYELSPAFDIVPSAQGLGVQAMHVGDRGAESSIDNAVSNAGAYGLKKDVALAIAAEVAAVVDGWRAHFQAAGVRKADLEVLDQYIDGGNLRSQRVALKRPAGAPAKRRAR
ncbi:type II toxin-antitoxin system HipA family toxin [Ramlibacter humi]|uniref:Type II toxin-antitoxin system HipA family toxin n=1 Tax=Ramlibacter humi TaxID=2530451 RepID=A0A4Z0CC06_9BURK|nr:type II toxin-antitoxin system HipA family toxin [Ramlibacter humi]TFZ07910.1 type II toxin-antitoxin system HipA family toxin [Ramlibacter humi]